MRDEPTGGRRFVVLLVAGRRLAIAIDAVEHVVHAVAVTPAAALPPPLIGWVNLHGERIAALDMRSRLGLPGRDLRLSDRMVLVRRGTMRWFLVVEGVGGVVDIAGDTDRPSATRAPAASDDEVGARISECCTSQVVLDEESLPIIDLSRLFTAQQVGLVQRALASGAEG